MNTKVLKVSKLFGAAVAIAAYTYPTTYVAGGGNWRYEIRDSANGQSEMDTKDHEWRNQEEMENVVDTMNCYLRDFHGAKSRKDVHVDVWSNLYVSVVQRGWLFPDSSVDIYPLSGRACNKHSNEENDLPQVEDVAHAFKVTNRVRGELMWPWWRPFFKD